MDLVRAEILCSGSLLPPPSTDGLGGPAVLGTLAMDMKKPHSVEDTGLRVAVPSAAVDDEILSTTNGPQLFS